MSDQDLKIIFVASEWFIIGIIVGFLIAKAIKTFEKQSMDKISIAIPNFNRYEYVIEAIAQVIGDERVGEIIISDDASTDGCAGRLVEFYKNEKKVIVFYHSINVDCYKNKKRAVGYCKNKWVILLDSDNVIGKDYLDRIYEEDWDEDIILTPYFALPHFSFMAYEGLVITKENVSEYIEKPMFETMLNAANYFVNRDSYLEDSYLEVWDNSVDPVTSDSIFMSYNWLKSGKKIKVVPGLVYHHRVHEQSHYRNNIHRTPAGFHAGIIKKLKELNG